MRISSAGYSLTGFRGPQRGHNGAVTFIQRFGSALNSTPHFHALVLDGVYPGPSHDLGTFVPLPPPETEDVARDLHAAQSALDDATLRQSAGRFGFGRLLVGTKLVENGHNAKSIQRRTFVYQAESNRARCLAVLIVALILGSSSRASAQSFSSSNLNFGGLGGVSQSTSLEFGSDGRLYVLQINGTIDIFTVQRNGVDDYVVVAAEELSDVKNVPNHNDDGSSDGGTSREATGITVAGTATNPVIYATSSDSRIGGPSGDQNLDTNSGVVTRLAWQGSDLNDPSGFWEVVDIVRGLPRSEENHATNGLEFVTLGSSDYLIISQGGHTNAGSPSTNFAWNTEFALSAAVLAVNLTSIEGMPIANDGVRNYIYNLPTVDDPTRANANGIVDPNNAGYDGVDLNDPWGGNDGLNQAKIVAGGPVQIFSPGYRNSYDLVVTESGAVYLTDNGANGGWGGYPENEGLSGTATNNYRPGEPGSNGADPVNGDPQVNNQDHLTLVTTDITSYIFGSFYGGHPSPIRSNPIGAGLFTLGSHSSDPGDSNGNGYTDDWFRTLPFDPNAVGDAADPQRALPADWPPVPVFLADPVQGDFRNPGGSNPDGPVDAIVTTWSNNVNGIDEYTASNFGGAMQGNLLAGKSGGSLNRVQLNPDGSLDTLTQNYFSGLGGNPLGVTANGDSDPFPGTIWVATFDSNIVVLEPQDFVICVLPGEPGYDVQGDNDSDGYTNGDEEDNGSDPCNGGSQPRDFDKVAGAPLVSDLNDSDDDADGSGDDVDVLQLGNPATSGSDAFPLPVVNELFSDNAQLGGYLGLGFTGMMNNGDPNPNWLDWIDQTDAGPNPNDILGGAVGAMTMQMTPGTALGSANNQQKGFQYGVQVDLATNGFRVESRMLNFDAGLQLYPFAGDGELGIFIGDGTQSNFIRFVVTHAGVEVLQEIADVADAPLSASIAVVDRPNTSLTLRLDVESASGSIEAFYAIDGGAMQSVGMLTAAGPILQAIQTTGVPLVVGLTGTSNTTGAEVEGTWDYLKVSGRQPSMQAPIPDLEEPLGGAATQDLDLDAFFDDDDGDANLVYTIQSESDPSIGTNITGSTLTLTFPAFVATSTITARATDGSGLFVEQTFSVSVTNAVPIYRINAGGPQLTASDAASPDWAADDAGSPSPQLADAGSNGLYSTSNTIDVSDASLSGTGAPAALFQNERWDAGGGTEMHWAFPLAPGQENVEVRLYVAEIYGPIGVGGRVFDVLVEGSLPAVFDDIDPFVLAGNAQDRGIMISTTVNVTDGTLDLELIHGVENPALKGIEIIAASGAPTNPILVTPIANQVSDEGDTIALPVLASGGDTPGSFAFSATGLPIGLQIEPTTGLIFGDIALGASVGSPYAVTVFVDDNDADPSDEVSKSFSWTVNDPNAILWIDLNEDETYTARHESSVVQAGDQFYIFGGRENAQTLDTYDYTSNTWTTSASAPLPFNHFQATQYEGLIWVIGAFETNSFPTEDPADDVWIFDPANDVWIQGPTIPVARRRGSSGLVVYNDKFYLVGGNTIGHDGGYVPWFDEFDPATGQWTQLLDAPHARDHFQTTVFEDKLYAIGGRLTGGAGGTFAPLIPEVDIYDFTTGTWSTLSAASNFPTPRAASANALFNQKIMVMGGEGNGIAYDTVEALDPMTNTWETLSSLNQARHGFGAIVSGNGVYVATGSPNQGGGNQKNMEVYNADEPSGTPSVAGVLSAPVAVTLVDGLPEAVSIDHTGGNQGILISSVVFSGVDAADFALLTPVTAAILLPVAGSQTFVVEYLGSAQTASASMDITYSGNQTVSIPVPEPGLIGGLALGAALLLGFERRRMRGSKM